MDEEKIEFLDLKRQAKTLEKSASDKDDAERSAVSFFKNATNPIMGAFLDFKRAKKFNIEDL